MKKILAMMLTAAMMLSMGTAVFADGEPTTTPAQPESGEAVDTSNWRSDEQSNAITLNKIYEISGANEALENDEDSDSKLFPDEKLTFNVTTVTVPTGETTADAPKVTVDPLYVSGNTSQTIVINLPVYDTVGVYEYTIKEDRGNTQGVNYTTSEAINVKVLVTYNWEEEKLDTKIVLSTVSTDEDDADGKVDTFVNAYDLGSLDITKNVTGNLGSTSKEFTVYVTLTSDQPVMSNITYVDGTVTDTITGASVNLNGENEDISNGDWTLSNGVYTTEQIEITLKHGETVHFYDIPAGVTYTVVEEDYTGGDKNGENGYDAAQYAYADTNTTDADKTISVNDTDVVTITNNKDTDVNTGISVDSIPYIAMLGVVAIGGTGIIVSKKRRSED